MLTSCGSDQDPDDAPGAATASPTDSASASASSSASEDPSGGSGDEGEPGSEAESGSASESAQPSPEGDTQTETAPSESEQPSSDGPDQSGTDPITGDFSTEPQETEDFPGGSGPRDQQLVAVRSGVHDGFDRVVFEFSGEGLPSWRAEYVDSAAELGRGNPIEVVGETILQIHVSGPSWLPEEQVEDRLASDQYYQRDTAALPEEVYIQGPFEALSQYLIGLPEEVPFSVELLEDPTRLVVDLENSGE